MSFSEAFYSYFFPSPMSRKILRLSAYCRTTLVLVCKTVLFAILFVPLAHSYSWQDCDGSAIKWTGHSTLMNISSNSFPSGSTMYIQLNDAMSQWNNVRGSDFRFSSGVDTGSTIGYNDSNQIAFVAASFFDPYVVAITKRKVACGRPLFGELQHYISETDIYFNVGEKWSTADFNPNLPTEFKNFELVALHELGHVMGLNHEDRVLATMNTYHPNGGAVGDVGEYLPLPDDRNGARFLYGNGEPEVELGTLAFKQITPGYSGPTTGSYNATAGGEANFEITIANFGTSPQAFKIGFYLSGNSIISTADRLLKTIYLSGWGPGIGTYTQKVIIPRDVSAGSYYLGFIVDPDNLISEISEWNNSQPMNHPLTVAAALTQLEVNSTGAANVWIVTNPPVYSDVTNYIKTGIPYGTAITLTASSLSSGAVFENWSGCDSAVENRCNILMNSNRAAAANYLPVFLVLTEANPASGGTVSCTPNPVVRGGSTTCSATPNSGYAFSGWSGACSGMSDTCTLTMDAAKSVTANFTGSLTNQTITFGSVPTVVVGGTGVLSATGGASGQPVIFSSLTEGICTVSGSTVTGVAAGTCTVAANQAGNGSYSAAPQVTQNITVTPPLPSGIDDNFVVVQFSSPSVLGAGAGDDTYLLSGPMLPAGKTLTLTDTAGSNSIQLASGLSIAASKVTTNALQLTLSSGAVINVLGADKFTYEPGGNSTDGINQADISYASFVADILGVTMPAGSAIATGGAVVIGGSVP